MTTDVEIAGDCGWKDAWNGFDGDEVPSIADIQHVARSTMREMEVPADIFEECVAAWIAAYREKAMAIVSRKRADRWYQEGREAAWNEFVKGDSMPSVADLVLNVKDVCEIGDVEAASFAAGWLAKAREIAAR